MIFRLTIWYIIVLFCVTSQGKRNKPTYNKGLPKSIKQDYRDIKLNKRFDIQVKEESITEIYDDEPHTNDKKSDALYKTTFNKPRPNIYNKIEPLIGKTTLEGINKIRPTVDFNYMPLTERERKVTSTAHLEEYQVSLINNNHTSMPNALKARLNNLSRDRKQFGKLVHKNREYFARPLFGPKPGNTGNEQIIRKKGLKLLKELKNCTMNNNNNKIGLKGPIKTLSKSKFKSNNHTAQRGMERLFETVSGKKMSAVMENYIVGAKALKATSEANRPDHIKKINHINNGKNKVDERNRTLPKFYNTNINHTEKKDSEKNNIAMQQPLHNSSTVVENASAQLKEQSIYPINNSLLSNEKKPHNNKNKQQNHNNQTRKITDNDKFGNAVQRKENIKNAIKIEQNETQNFLRLPNETTTWNSSNVASIERAVDSNNKEGTANPPTVMINWGPWSTCSATCGTNAIQIRTRKCKNVTKAVNTCESTVDWRPCAERLVCPQDKKNVEQSRQWGQWSRCPNRCLPKTIRVRRRKCPGQRNNKTGVCEQPTMQWDWCKQKHCRASNPEKIEIKSNKTTGYNENQVHDNECYTSSWSTWTLCSQTCGENARKFRTRSCSCEQYSECTEPIIQWKSCMLAACSDEQQYGPWSEFSSCSKSCGGGWRKRTRQCISNKNSTCQQDFLIGVRECNTEKCPAIQKGFNQADVNLNRDPEKLCGFVPCKEFGCVDNPFSQCQADSNCDPVFTDIYGSVIRHCIDYGRYYIKQPFTFCGYDPCSSCRRTFGNCFVDLNCQPITMANDGTLIQCRRLLSSTSY